MFCEYAKPRGADCENSERRRGIICSHRFTNLSGTLDGIRTFWYNEIMSEGVPHVDKSESTQTKLEDLLKVTIDPEVSFPELLNNINNHDWTRFIVDQNFKIVLSTKLHSAIRKTIGINIEDCLWFDGSFRIYPSKSLKFTSTYRSDEDITKRELYLATEHKIIEFLKSNKLEWNDWATGFVSSSNNINRSF